MNTKILVLGAAVAAFAFNSFAAQPLLSPRAAGNQIKTASRAESAAPAVTVAYVETAPTLLSPRAAGNQIKVLKGVSNEINPVTDCRNNMAGTPRAVTECTSHATMPACKTLAAK